MTYSLTERKRIRKSFAKRANVQPVPFLLATQLESYTAFLQAHVAPESRRNEGLQAAFTSIFPISSHSGNARLEFVSFQLGEPPFDVKDSVFFRVDRRRKMPVTILLKALGYTPERILKEFFAFDTFTIEPNSVLFEIVPERLRGEVARFDITDKSGKTIVAKDKRITVKHIRDMETAGLKKINAPDDFVLGRTLAHNVINKDTGEIIANANDELPETLLQQLQIGRAHV